MNPTDPNRIDPNRIDPVRTDPVRNNPGRAESAPVQPARINLTIDRIVLRGFDPADRKAILEGLQSELARTLADPATRADWAHPHRTPVLNLGRLPSVPGPSGSRNLGTRIGGAIGKGLRP